MDVVGRIFLSDGTALSAVTGIDDDSRFCVIAKLVVRPRLDLSAMPLSKGSLARDPRIDPH